VRNFRRGPISTASVVVAITEAQETSFMLSKIVLATALAIAAFTTIVPASATPGDYPYPSGYEDMAYNRSGW
jgi:hypothetical protein